MSNEHEQYEVEFMKQEYSGIVQAFGDLYNVILKVFNFYLLIAAIPFSIGAILYKESPDKFHPYQMPMSIAVLFVLIPILGFLSTISMVHLRMEQILYARTVNCIRKYFHDLSAKKVESYLSLPITDTLPPFWEAGRAFFWQVVIIGLIDGVYGYLGLVNIIDNSCSKWILFIISLLFFLTHIGIYWLAAFLRERRYNVRCPALVGRKENY